MFTANAFTLLSAAAEAATPELGVDNESVMQPPPRVAAHTLELVIVPPTLSDVEIDAFEALTLDA